MSEEVTPETREETPKEETPKEETPKKAVIGVVSRGPGFYSGHVPLALLNILADASSVVVLCRDRPSEPVEGVIYVQEARRTMSEIEQIITNIELSGFKEDFGYTDNRAGRRAEKFNRNMPDEPFGKPSRLHRRGR